MNRRKFLRIAGTGAISLGVVKAGVLPPISTKEVKEASKEIRRLSNKPFKFREYGPYCKPQKEPKLVYLGEYPAKTHWTIESNKPYTVTITSKPVDLELWEWMGKPETMWYANIHRDNGDVRAHVWTKDPGNPHTIINDLPLKVLINA